MSSTSWAQIDPSYIGTLPSLVTESSGLECEDDGLCYTFNDSEANTRLYRITPEGGFISQVLLQNALHVDYEDIALSNDGRAFIGDFGNNDNDRQDLRIYIVDDLSIGSLVETSIISYTYEDQSAFPPSEDELRFDVESMIHMEDSLVLFTRNRTSPYDGLIHIYMLADSPGAQVARHAGIIFANLAVDYSSIRAADISPDGSRIALISRGAMYILTNWGNTINSATLNYSYFNELHPYEGLAFINNCEVRISEEGTDAGIYSLNTCDIVTSLSESPNIIAPYARVRDGNLHLSDASQFIRFEIYDLSGKLHLTGPSLPITPLPDLNSGLYVIQLTSGMGSTSQQLYID